MNTNRNKLRTALLSVTGIIAIAFAYQLGFARGSEESAVNYQPVDIRTAQTFHQSYYRGATAPFAPVRAFAVNIDQFNAMRQLSMENPSLNGFRIYFGQNSGNNPVMMVLGTIEGRDQASSIYLTSPNNAGLCPVICDMSSQMTLDE